MHVFQAILLKHNLSFFHNDLYSMTSSSWYNKWNKENLEHFWKEILIFIIFVIVLVHFYRIKAEYTVKEKIITSFIFVSKILKLLLIWSDIKLLPRVHNFRLLIAFHYFYNYCHFFIVSTIIEWIDSI